MTPIEKYNDIFVKREDLCFDPPAPPFSKCRGIIKHLEKLKQQGIETVGYTETSISMAGWGLAWACHLLSMKAVIFDPQYKTKQELLDYHRTKWKEFKAETIPIQAGRAKVNWYLSKKILEKEYGKSAKMLPLGLPLQETINETAKELVITLQSMEEIINTIVVCVGSGTICAGIIKGLNYFVNYPAKVYGIMSRDGNLKLKKKIVLQKAGIMGKGFFGKNIKLEIINEGWNYSDKSNFDCPFPCHPYYDLKAWEFTMKKVFQLETPVLFWNIGRLK
jgi:1-aminocyclopropane-1-carboxylate deaminase/D-cysteine desulfhydrase-like pyridoxal-dependent ACC family enzyme